MPKMPRQSLIQAPTTTPANSQTNPSKAVSASQADDKAKASYVGGDAALNSVNFKAIPNPLSDVYSPTYHFSFYLDTDIEGAQGQGNTVVIAETGITGMNIQDVQIESFVGPNLQSRNATATAITMKIFEPYGATLPDLLFQAAIKLQINNYLKAPWYLSLKFMGYQEQTGTPTAIGDTYVWKVLLQDIDSHISELGATHTVTMLPLSEEAFSNKYCTLPVSANGKGSTVGDIAQQVIKYMNTDSKFRYGETTPLFIEYSIEDRPYTTDTKVGVSKPFDHKVTTDNPQTSNQTNAPDYNSSTGQFAPGTDVLAMLDMLFSSSKTAIKQARLSRELPPDNGPDDEKNIAAVNSVMHRIDSVVEYGPYNSLFGDYCKKIKYIVKPFDSLRLLTSVGRAQSFDAEPDLNIKKAQYANDKKFMRKEYQYIFSGMNTEVEKFDITTNFSWSCMVPMLQGYVGGASPAKVDPSATPAQHAAAANSGVSNYEAARADAANKQDAAQKVLNDANATADDKAAAVKEANDATTKAQSLFAPLNANKQALTTDSQNSINSANTNSSKARSTLLGKPYYDLESDVTANAVGGASTATKTGGALYKQQSYLPISIVQSADQTNVHTTTGTQNDQDNVKSLYGALLNQMYGTFSNNLQDITLEIKGDPYWIGPGASGNEYTTPSSDTMPNFLNGEHIFVFRFKLPMGYNEATGTAAISGENNQAGKANSDIYTGFYAVTSVTNKFSQGKFTQSLDATRVPGWTINNILNGDHGTADNNTNYVNNPVDTGGTGGSATNKPSGASSSVPNPNGNSRGTRNNNPGNLKATSYVKSMPGYIGTDDNGFAQFDSYADGVNAQTNLLSSKYLSQPTTVTNVVDKYLGYPNSNENSTASRNNYIAHVTQTLGKSTVTAADASKLSQAMRQFETGDKNA